MLKEPVDLNKEVSISSRAYHEKQSYQEPSTHCCYAPVIGFPGMGDPRDTGGNRNFLHYSYSILQALGHDLKAKSPPWGDQKHVNRASC